MFARLSWHEFRYLGNCQNELANNKRNLMKKEILKTKLTNAIDAKYMQIVSGKAEGSRYLTYPDGQSITHSIRSYFMQEHGSVPNEISFACTMSEVILAPSTAERIKLIRQASSLGLGAAGIIAILTAIGMALGWGQGAIAAVIVWFVGGPVTWPIILGVGGAALVCIAGYFAVYDNPQKQTERFITTLKNSVTTAVDACGLFEEAPAENETAPNPA
jgi:hypothetical protein